MSDIARFGSQAVRTRDCEPQQPVEIWTIVFGAPPCGVGWGDKAKFFTLDSTCAKLLSSVKDGWPKRCADAASGSGPRRQSAREIFRLFVSRLNSDACEAIRVCNALLLGQAAAAASKCQPRRRGNHIHT